MTLHNVDRLKLSAVQTRIFVCLYCSPLITVNKIAGICNMQRKTVLNNIEKLVNKGFAIVNKKKKQTRYHLVPKYHDQESCIREAHYELLGSVLNDPTLNPNICHMTHPEHEVASNDSYQENNPSNSVSNDTTPIYNRVVSSNKDISNTISNSNKDILLYKESLDQNELDVLSSYSSIESDNE